MKHAAYFLPTLLVVALMIAGVSISVAQQRKPADFRYQHKGKWIEIDRLSTQGNLMWFTVSGISAVAIARPGGNPSSEYATVTIGHASGSIRIDCDNVEEAIVFAKFLIEAE